MNSISSFFPESDDLDEMMKAPSDPVRAAKAKAAEEAKIGFVEKCPSCRGTGTFRSFSGRALGTCFKCKGKGEKTFKQPAAKRAQTRIKAAERKINKLAEDIAAFKTAYPAVWSWMENNSWEFAVNMRDALQKWGHLTDKQLAACEKCAAKRSAAIVERKAAEEVRVAAAPTVDTSKLEEAFATAAANGLGSPKLRFAGLAISPAGATSKNAGALYVKADGVYVGKIMSGKFLAIRECTAEISARVVDAINDPEAAAIAYGRATGSCSCCGRRLTNPASIELGIGPICAETFGWGG